MLPCVALSSSHTSSSFLCRACSLSAWLTWRGRQWAVAAGSVVWDAVATTAQQGAAEAAAAAAAAHIGCSNHFMFILFS